MNGRKARGPKWGEVAEEGAYFETINIIACVDWLALYLFSLPHTCHTWFCHFFWSHFSAAYNIRLRDPRQKCTVAAETRDSGVSGGDETLHPKEFDSRSLVLIPTNMTSGWLTQSWLLSWLLSWLSSCLSGAYGKVSPLLGLQYFALGKLERFGTPLNQYECDSHVR